MIAVSSRTMNGRRGAWLGISFALCFSGACTPPNVARNMVYVGGYGGEVTVLDFDPHSGALRERSRMKAGGAPSYLAFTRDARFAFAIDEARSEVIAFEVDRREGGLRELNRAASGGSGPAHLAVHPSGNWLAVAHYGGGETAILPIGSDGRIGRAGAVSKGPNGGCKHAHQAVYERAGARLYVPCLGSNYIVAFTFAAGTLGYGESSLIPIAGGPRHLAFDPADRRVYVLSEHESIITSFDVDASSGRWSGHSTVRSYERTPGASAHLEVHPNGRFLYVSNRGENSLGVFALEPGREPRAVGFVTDGIATPRDFEIDASGRWLLVANQAGRQDVVMFEIDASSGRLTRRDAAAVGGEPAFVGVTVLP